MYLADFGGEILINMGFVVAVLEVLFLRLCWNPFLAALSLLVDPAV